MNTRTAQKESETIFRNLNNNNKFSGTELVSDISNMYYAI